MGYMCTFCLNGYNRGTACVINIAYSAMDGDPLSNNGCILNEIPKTL